MTDGLRGSSLRSGRLSGRGEVDPLSSMANIADIMLVFACGLMMALVTFWNIDLSSFTEVEDDQLEAIENPEDLPEDLVSGGSSYIEKGTVYQDPTTGKFYMLTQDEESMEEELANSDSNSSDTSSSGSATRSGSSTNSPNKTSSGAKPVDRSTGAD